MESIETKICSVCGETKPINQFKKSNMSADGHTHICKCCSAKKAKKKKATIEDNEPVIPELAKYTQRELAAELRRRGCTGELHYTEVKTIIL